MTRPILGLLAAATLSFGVVGTAPAQAAAPTAFSAPARDHDRDHRDDHKYTRQHGHTRHDHDDDDHHDGGRRGRRCDGHLIAICLL